MTQTSSKSPKEGACILEEKQCLWTFSHTFAHWPRVGYSGKCDLGLQMGQAAAG